MKSVDKVDVFGVPISTYKTLDEAACDIYEHHMGKASTAIAINPEKIMTMEKSQVLADFIKQSTINYADGIGVVMAVKMKTGLSVSRIAGCDLWLKLMERSVQHKKSVFLIGAKEEVVSVVADKLRQELSVDVCGYQNGYFADDEVVINQLLQAKPDVVCLALGSPKQELLINKLKSAGLASFMMGVGGTFDVYSGHTRRAPVFFQRLGLEWFYRLVTDIRRINRQSNLVKFFLRLIKLRFSSGIK